MRCPLCQTELPDDALQCDRCDWVRDSPLPRVESADWLAAALSIVPGLGHLYKGHLVPGLLLLCLLGPAFLVVVMLLIQKTLGLSLILPAIFVAFTAAHAFRLPDARRYPGVKQQAIKTLSRWLDRVPRRDSKVEH